MERERRFWESQQQQGGVCQRGRQMEYAPPRSSDIPPPWTEEYVHGQAVRHASRQAPSWIDNTAEKSAFASQSQPTLSDTYHPMGTKFSAVAFNEQLYSAPYSSSSEQWRERSADRYKHGNRRTEDLRTISKGHSYSAQWRDDVRFASERDRGRSWRPSPPPLTKKQKTAFPKGEHYKEFCNSKYKDHVPREKTVGRSHGASSRNVVEESRFGSSSKHAEEWKKFELDNIQGVLEMDTFYNNSAPEYDAKSQYLFPRGSSYIGGVKEEPRLGRADVGRKAQKLPVIKDATTNRFPLPSVPAAAGEALKKFGAPTHSAVADMHHASGRDQLGGRTKSPNLDGGFNKKGKKEKKKKKKAAKGVAETKRVQDCLQREQPNPIKVFVLPKTARSGFRTLSKIEYHKISDAIQKAILKSKGGVKPQFLGSEYQNGKVAIICANMQTKQWLEEVIIKKNPLHNKELYIGTHFSAPPRVNVSVEVEGTYSEGELLKMITRQNRGLSTYTWSILNSHGTSKGTQKLTLGINMSSLHQLVKNDFKLFFGLGRLTFTLMDKDIDINAIKEELRQKGIFIEGESSMQAELEGTVSASENNPFVTTSDQQQPFASDNAAESEEQEQSNTEGKLTSSNSMDVEKVEVECESKFNKTAAENSGDFLIVEKVPDTDDVPQEIGSIVDSNKTVGETVTVFKDAQHANESGDQDVLKLGLLESVKMIDSVEVNDSANDSFTEELGKKHSGYVIQEMILEREDTKLIEETDKTVKEENGDIETASFSESFVTDDSAVVIN